MKHKHLLAMALCCGIPILLLLVLSMSVNIEGRYLYLLLILLCPLMHFLMMTPRRRKKSRIESHDKTCTPACLKEDLLSDSNIKQWFETEV